MEEKLENLADENVVDEIDSVIKDIVNNMDKILLRNKRGFEELYRKGIIYGVDKKCNSSY